MGIIRRFFVRIAVTPERTRRVVARSLSLFLQWAMESKAWETVSLLPKWLRRLADFIECWNEASIQEDRDRLLAELVRYAVTDEAVERLIDTVVGLEAESNDASGVRVLSRPEIVKMIRNAR